LRVLTYNAVCKLQLYQYQHSPRVIPHERSSCKWLFINSPGLVSAANSDNSPDKTVQAAMIANRLALSPGARLAVHPNKSKLSCTNGSPLPLPTLPIIKLGNV